MVICRTNIILRCSSHVPGAITVRAWMMIRTVCIARTYIDVVLFGIYSVIRSLVKSSNSALFNEMYIHSISSILQPNNPLRSIYQYLYNIYISTLVILVRSRYLILSSRQSRTYDKPSIFEANTIKSHSTRLRTILLDPVATFKMHKNPIGLSYE
jgi:hypothetical protein